MFCKKSIQMIYAGKNELIYINTRQWHAQVRENFIITLVWFQLFQAAIQ